MPDAADFAEDLLTAAILEDLLRMRGSHCQECGAALCGHEMLMSLVAGYKESPRCLSCLARLLGQRREQLRDYLLGYIKSRPCRQSGWLWANREEGTDPDALPRCMWPPGGIAEKEGPLPPRATAPARDSTPPPVADAEWDAGVTGCGELVMGIRMRLQPMAPGQVLKLTATDPGVPEDLPAWCRLTGHRLLASNHPEYWIQRKGN